MEKRLQLWSPVWGWLATKEGESVDLKGQDLVLYETAIQEALEQEKLYYRKKSAPFNLMDYYDADDSVKEKVQNPSSDRERPPMCRRHPPVHFGF